MVLGLDVVVALLKLTRFHTCYCTSSSACPITINNVPVPLPSSYRLVPTTLSPRILHYVCNTQMLLSLSLPSLSPSPHHLSLPRPPLFLSLPSSSLFLSWPPSYPLSLHPLLHTFMYIHMYSRQIHLSPSLSSYDPLVYSIKINDPEWITKWSKTPFSSYKL